MNIGAKKYYGITFSTANTKFISHKSSKSSYRRGATQEQAGRIEHQSGSNICTKKTRNDSLLKILISETTRTLNMTKNDKSKNLAIETEETGELEGQCDEFGESSTITDNSRQVLIRAGSMKLICKKKYSKTATKKKHNPSKSIAKRLPGIGTDNDSYTPNAKISGIPFTPMSIAKQFKGNLFDTPDKSETCEFNSSSSIKSGCLLKKFNMGQNSSQMKLRK
jgi:hypothetical protein